MSSNWDILVTVLTLIGAVGVTTALTFLAVVLWVLCAGALEDRRERRRSQVDAPAGARVAAAVDGIGEDLEAVQFEWAE